MEPIAHISRYIEPTECHDALSLALDRKSDFCIPRSETMRPRSQSLHSCVCEQFILYQDQSVYLAEAK